GQIVDVDRWPRREYQEPFDGIGQLADVPRPRVPLKDPHRLRRQRLVAQPSTLVQGQEVLRQTRDVLRPLAQRRQGDAEDVEAVQEVLAEPTGAHQLVEDLRSEEHTLNSSHVAISYAVFCLKKKKPEHRKPGGYTEG